jgi:hypothetical protein
MVARGVGGEIGRGIQRLGRSLLRLLQEQVYNPRFMPAPVQIFECRRSRILLANAVGSCA